MLYEFSWRIETLPTVEKEGAGDVAAAAHLDLLSTLGIFSTMVEITTGGPGSQPSDRGRPGRQRTPRGKGCHSGGDRRKLDDNGKPTVMAVAPPTWATAGSLGLAYHETAGHEVAVVD